MLAQEVPSAPLYYGNQVFFLHPSVHGWHNKSLRLVDWRQLWLEPSK